MNDRLLTKKNTLMLHGMGILMMIYHHLFITGNTWYVKQGTSLFDVLNPINFGPADTFQLTFAWFCKICVAIFSFTSGYAMYIQLNKRCTEKIDLKKMYLYCIKRLWSFYKKFLLCFLFFISYDYFSGNQNGFDYSLVNYILNLLGIRATYNATWWYILVYYYMILISPLVYILLEKMKTKHYIFLVVLGVVSFGIAFVSGHIVDYYKMISGFIQNYIVIYLIIFIEGMFCCKYSILEIIASKLNVFSASLLLIITFVLRVLLIRAPSDSLFDLVLIVPFVTSITKLFNYSKHLSNALSYIGKYSSYMWYSHAYFYSYLFFNMVLKCDLSLFVYLQVVVYSLLTSIVLAQIEGLLTSLINRLHKKQLS